MIFSILRGVVGLFILFIRSCFKFGKRSVLRKLSISFGFEFGGIQVSSLSL